MSKQLQKLHDRRHRQHSRAARAQEKRQRHHNPARGTAADAQVADSAAKRVTAPNSVHDEPTWAGLVIGLAVVTGKPAAYPAEPSCLLEPGKHRRYVELQLCIQQLRNKQLEIARHSSPRWLCRALEPIAVQQQHEKSDVFPGHGPAEHRGTEHTAAGLCSDVAQAG